MNALIVADGDVPTAAQLERSLGSAPSTIPWMVFAADGGALKAEALGLSPDVVVSDGDSLTEHDLARLARLGAEIVRHQPEKDHSDTELAIGEALRRGATTLRVLGAFGGTRLEHTLANVLLLALPALRGLDAALVDADTTVRLAIGAGTVAVAGDPGDFVSLLPTSARVEGVTTSGLVYPLVGEPLHQGPTRGLSNQMTGRTASVSVRAGRLLVVHTRRGTEVTA